MYTLRRSKCHSFTLDVIDAYICLKVHIYFCLLGVKALLCAGEKGEAFDRAVCCVKL